MLYKLLLALRNGALLATLAATPILVGFLWNALWGEPDNISSSTYLALVLAWLAATGVVTALSFYAIQTRGADSVRWFYKCQSCGSPVAIISYRCLHCRTNFTPPSTADTFRNALLMGVGVFYALFTLGTILPRF